MNDNNPFQAPAARVADVYPGAAGEFIPDGQRVSAGNGVAWLRRGWEMFRQAPGPWIGITVIFCLLILISSLLPIINLLANLVTALLIGGLMIGCKRLEESGELQIGDLFAGFSSHAGNLALVGLIFMVGTVAIIIAAFIVGGVLGIAGAMSGLGSDMLSGEKASLTMLLPLILLFLFAMLFMIPLAMAFWFAPALVVFHDVEPFQAMKASFMACLKNIVPFLVYGLVWFLLAIVATLPLFLGWLVLLPVTYASIYFGYQDMFTRR